MGTRQEDFENGVVDGSSNVHVCNIDDSSTFGSACSRGVVDFGVELLVGTMSAVADCRPDCPSCWVAVLRPTIVTELLSLAQ